MPFLANPTTTKITHVTTDKKMGIAMREVIGKLMNGVTSKKLPTSTKRKRAKR